ncbi:MAG: Ni/Fe-hydrogenase cytochrome b subunit [Deltaproteobacteria bacterium]|nr:Ni/Fe-hydrogenase cytochrome b subunit [Deltaproteobacteria bacterium]PWB63949.1 MAG: Ni/Fe-hydrogenase cytochrome b subunit [Deltaproteobacteria bacterium]
MNSHFRPVGGPILTKTFLVSAAVFAVSAAILVWRFIVGLGPTTAMSDLYPWGIWITYDVVVGTALACGGYAVALLCYVLNKGKYHHLIRPAILTSALGYTLAGVSVIIDLGRYWNVWKVPLLWNWNRNSILLEVAICIMSYVVVLWIELSPAFIEKWEEDAPWQWLRNLSIRIHPWLNKILIPILALGILLPTMHQSSLGSMMLIAMHKLHKLWHTPFLPLLFLLSCIVMGYAAVVFETALADSVFKLPRETKLLAPLSVAMVIVLFAYLAVRIADLAYRGRLGLIFRFDFYSFMFLLEMALFLTPAVLLLFRRFRYNPGVEFVCAMMMMAGGLLYRFDAFLVGFKPAPGWNYFPSVPEMFVTFGLVAFEVMAYLFIVKTFPILGGAPHAAAGTAHGVAGVPAPGR